MLKKALFLLLVVLVSSTAQAQDSIENSHMRHKTYASFKIFSGQTGTRSYLEQLGHYNWVQPLHGYEIGIGKRKFLSPGGSSWVQWGLHYGMRRFVASATDSVSLVLGGSFSLPAHQATIRQNFINVPVSFHATGRINEQFSLIGFVGSTLNMSLFGKQEFLFSGTNERIQTRWDRSAVPVDGPLLSFQTGFGMLWQSEKNMQIAVTPYFEYAYKLSRVRPQPLPNPWFLGVKTSVYFSGKRSK